MKNLCLRNAPIILLTLIFATSCVTKRKYIETDTARIDGLNRIDALNQKILGMTDRIADLKAEFNEMQNELRLSNAQKDAYIDSISKKEIGLTSVISQKDESLNDQILACQIERVRLNSSLAQQQATIEGLTAKLNDRESEIAQIKLKSANLQFDLTNQKQESASKAGSLVKMVEQQKKLQSEIDWCNKQTSALKKQIADKNSEIEKLTNNVRLLKKQ